MTTLTPAQIAQVATQAGFRGNAVTMAVAIAMAESGGRVDGPPNATGDVGLWQINLPTHPQYTVAFLQNATNNAAVAYAISGGGSSWTRWCTAYGDGACGTRGGAYLAPSSPYRKYIGIAQNTATGGTAPSPVTLPTPVRWDPRYLADLTNWIHHPNVWMYGRWLPGGPGRAEGGVDMGSPPGTPIYALATGPLQGAGNFWHSAGNPGYGVVTERVNVPGYGLQDLYYQHINIDPAIKFCKGGNCGGQIIHKGQRIGNIIAGVGMLEMGFNAGWHGIWGENHPGPWVTDPRKMIVALMNLGPPGTPEPPYTGATNSPTTATGTDSSLTSTNTATSGVSTIDTRPDITYTSIFSQVHTTLINTPGFYGMALALDEAEQFPGFVDLAYAPQVITIPTTNATVDIPDIKGGIRSAAATVSDNFMPFAIRSGIVLLGGILLIALLIKPIGSVAGGAASLVAANPELLAL